jgi:hypothetical protein
MAETQEMYLLLSRAINHSIVFFIEISKLEKIGKKIQKHIGLQ